MKNALQIIPVKDGYLVHEIFPPNTVPILGVIAVRVELGASFRYPTDPATLIGFIREYYDKPDSEPLPESLPESP